MLDILGTAGWPTLAYTGKSHFSLYDLFYSIVVWGEGE